MKSIFPYIGGKHKVAHKLLKLFPDHKCYVELFAGAANLFFAKPKTGVEVINDVNGDIVNLFRVIRWHPEEFINELAFITHNRQDFDDFHNQPGLTDIQRAARHWFKLKTTFGGTAPSGNRTFSIGTTKGASMRISAYQTIDLAHQRLDGAYIENGDFEKIVKRYDRKHTFFFCDPPYWKAADYGVPFGWDSQERLSRVLRSIKGKFLLTINNHPDIRKLYKGLPFKKLLMKYTIHDTAKKKKVYELVIANYPLPRRW